MIAPDQTTYDYLRGRPFVPSDFDAAVAHWEKLPSDTAAKYGKAEGRDNHVLVSAQACFLPIPQDRIAEFNPVLFNYQSYAGDPAVLAILATREGTSITVIDNQRDAFAAGRTWGQRLFFNQNGERASLTGERKSDFLADVGSSESSDTIAADSKREGLNMVLLVQVPLKQKEPMRFGGVTMGTGGEVILFCDSCLVDSDVEEAVIGHGKIEGPFTEVDGLEIERDDRYPVRVTVQFYKATSNGVVSAHDMSDIAAQINKVYQQAGYVGSLVVDGPAGRPTEYEGPHFEPPHWWHVFWQQHFENTGQSREDAIAMLQKLLGDRWQSASLADAEEALNEGGESIKDAAP
jgi:hypothetical protein